METGENNPIIQIVDKSFNNDFLNQYHLSIELSKKTLSYCIIDTKKLRSSSFWKKIRVEK